MRKRLLLLACVGLALVLIAGSGLGEYLSFDALKPQQLALVSLYEARPVAFAAAYFAIYVLITALSIPGASVITLAGGAIFGWAKGTLLVSFASTGGATLAFLISRYLFHDVVQRRFGDRLAKINEGIRKEGAFYLFALRLIPAFPFFIVNLLMGLTPIRTWTYVWVSQTGMLLATLAFVNAGTQLGKLESPSGILSPELLASFAALGILPIAAKKAITWLKKLRASRCSP